MQQSRVQNDPVNDFDSDPSAQIGYPKVPSKSPAIKTYPIRQSPKLKEFKEDRNVSPVNHRPGQMPHVFPSKTRHSQATNKMGLESILNIYSD